MSARGSGISRKEGIALLLHRGLDRWLSPLGVWVYGTRGRPHDPHPPPRAHPGDRLIAPAG